MYLDYTVEVPESKGKTTFREKNGVTYVYYEYERTYDPVKKYTTVKRRTIGKLIDGDPARMRPNENFKKFFPDEYSGAAEPLFRKSGNRLSGIGNRRIA